MPQAATQDQQVCFVVMGFGKKTDYETGRTLDLDASYEAIIKPAATDAGLRCVRADEINHSGVIDEKMYDMLLRADLVIADLSTSNPNALYELGVRHALKPYATILIKEKDGRFHFDLNHVVTMEYQHLGPDIGAREANLKKEELSERILAVMKAQETDSPVYTFIEGLEGPRLAQSLELRLSVTDFDAAFMQAQMTDNRLATLIKQGEQAGRDGRHADAAKAFAAAVDVRPSEDYLRQQLALHTYKSEIPSERAALEKAIEILRPLDPENSADPETLGIAGAIHKRLFSLTGARTHLDDAIRFYGRGFEVRRDYYNGENLAACLDLRAAEQQDPEERLYDRLKAKKTRETLVTILDGIRHSASFDERSDKKWVFATLANVNFALGNSEAGENGERDFRAQGPVGWEIDTYQEGKQHALSVAAAASGKLLG